jgi:hypothetical protein
LKNIKEEFLFIAVGAGWQDSRDLQEIWRASEPGCTMIREDVSGFVDKHMGRV